MPRPEQPDKDTMCHRTGFTKTCFECVTQHGCRLWKRVTLTDRHPETGAEIGVDVYDCLDSFQELFWKDMLRRQLQTTATVDKVSKTVREAHDAGMIGALERINREIDERRAALSHDGAALAIAGPATALPPPSEQN